MEKWRIWRKLLADNVFILAFLVCYFGTFSSFLYSLLPYSLGLHDVFLCYFGSFLYAVLLWFSKPLTLKVKAYIDMNTVV